MLMDDFRNAMRRNDKAHARELLTALRHFTATHRDELLSERGAATPEAERA